MTNADTENMIDLVERQTGYRVTVDVISGIYEHAQMISARPEAPAHIIRVNADRRRHADYKMKADPLHGFFSLAPSDGERAGVSGSNTFSVHSKKVFNPPPHPLPASGAREH